MNTLIFTAPVLQLWFEPKNEVIHGVKKHLLISTIVLW